MMGPSLNGTSPSSALFTAMAASATSLEYSTRKVHYRPLETARRVVHGVCSARRSTSLVAPKPRSPVCTDDGLCIETRAQQPEVAVSRNQFHIESASLSAESEAPYGHRRVHPFGGWVDL